MPTNPLSLFEIQGQFTSTGRSPLAWVRPGLFNLSLSGFGTAVIVLERSFDGGASWKTVESFTQDSEEMWPECEHGVVYSLNCVSYGEGPVDYRISQ